MPKKSRKSLLGPLVFRGQSGRSPESPGLFRHFSGSQARGPRRHFRDFFGISGRETPVRGDLVPFARRAVSIKRLQ